MNLYYLTKLYAIHQSIIFNNSYTGCHSLNQTVEGAQDRCLIAEAAKSLIKQTTFSPTQTRHNCNPSRISLSEILCNNFCCSYEPRGETAIYAMYTGGENKLDADFTYNPSPTVHPHNLSFIPIHMHLYKPNIHYIWTRNLFHTHQLHKSILQ